MNRRSYLKKSLLAGSCVLLPAGALFLVGRSGMRPVNGPVGFSGRIMGTGYSVSLGSATRDLPKLHQSVHDVLVSIDHTMSTWRSSSELSTFNTRRDLDWQAFSSATLKVVKHATQTSMATLGAFDATIAPLVNLWGFGAGQSHFSAGFSTPSQNAVSKVVSEIGYQSIQIDESSNSIRKLHYSAQLDLSGIAKGYAVDQVAKLLDAHGLDNYLIEVGGELRSRGKNAQNTPWRVAIERPYAKQQSAYRIISLANSAVATSGDYRNFYLNGGIRYSHSIDPRSGSPVNHELASVSVIAPTTMQADALSTAFMVMGPSDALAHANKHKIAAHLILKSETGALTEVHSQAFDSFQA